MHPRYVREAYSGARSLVTALGEIAPAGASALGAEWVTMVPMKLAVAGKGGSGKTSISGTLARMLARSGHNVLAIDGDSNPNLALTLGIPAERMSSMPVLPSNLLVRSDTGTSLKHSLEEICASHSLTGPDGVNLLVMAHPQHAGTG